MEDELEQRIAEMSDAEFDRLVARTRAPKLTPDAVRKAEQANDWKRSFDLKTAQLRNLMNPEQKKD